MSMYILLAIEIVTVLAVIGLTIWVMQARLSCAHHLLRLGVAIVCAGSVLELALSVVHFADTTAGELAHQIITNIGQIVVYLWVATSKVLPRLLAEEDTYGKRIGTKSYLDCRGAGFRPRRMAGSGGAEKSQLPD